jgi:hypothetical protein
MNGEVSRGRTAAKAEQYMAVRGLSGDGWAQLLPMRIAVAHYITRWPSHPIRWEDLLSVSPPRTVGSPPLATYDILHRSGPSPGQQRHFAEDTGVDEVGRTFPSAVFFVLL